MEDIPKAPDARTLRETALAHLARFATTELGLRQVLERRVRRWGTRAMHAGMAAEEVEAISQGLKPAIEDTVHAMSGLGAVDDAGFARSRALSLTRTGRSRRAVAAHLATKGVDQDTTRAALDESLGERSDENASRAELAAALVLARKRRLGPFRRDDRPDEDPMKALAVFARNGFSRDVAQSALDMDLEEAEDRIFEFRSL
ncbi:regulatory protein RecX [Gluconobacter wancherniae]|uniref:Regulatory protein RecX n=1 Tax=Gluconobacter wancherniae NBRC 103581 TaxID=656744 RepID=A0A511AZZ6_9PROT|nr:RecX family transcriptional regulator [Gluconobacter wancherniae]MBF0854391.1 regulatory protein RecX [Gluconobacter wancherniae]MBS1062787.1 RecX family transcriptional regulator [Gluconobacter wancherniae]MBS1094921.1 RecX family transcriptional regulator [Gluconobacter wancherniae]GBD57452.1 regulatory protein RecX [Gluconobacter wancherniae NBRC 103581]GBR62686.1 recombinase A [Gluconobacter wancherniae NBRC 103581]